MSDSICWWLMIAEFWMRAFTTSLSNLHQVLLTKLFRIRRVRIQKIWCLLVQAQFVFVGYGTGVISILSWLSLISFSTAWQLLTTLWRTIQRNRYCYIWHLSRIRLLNWWLHIGVRNSKQVKFGFSLSLHLLYLAWVRAESTSTLKLLYSIRIGLSIFGGNSKGWSMHDVTWCGHLRLVKWIILQRIYTLILLHFLLE